MRIYLKNILKIVMCIAAFCIVFGAGRQTTSAAVSINSYDDVEQVFAGSAVASYQSDTRIVYVTLSKDISFDTVVNMNMECLIIDLNGHNISCSGKDGKACMVVGAGYYTVFLNSGIDKAEIALDGNMNGICVEGQLMLNDVGVYASSNANAIYCDNYSYIDTQRATIQGGRTAINVAGNKATASITNSILNESNSDNVAMGVVNITGTNANVSLEDTLVDARKHRYSVYQNAEGSVLHTDNSTIQNSAKDTDGNNGVYVAAGSSQLYGTAVTSSNNHAICSVADGLAELYSSRATSISAAGVFVSGKASIYGGEYVGGQFGMMCAEGGAVIVGTGEFMGVKYTAADPVGSIYCSKEDTDFRLYKSSMLDMDKVEQNTQDDGIVKNFDDCIVSLDTAEDKGTYKVITNKNVSVISNIKEVSLEKDTYDKTGSEIKPKVIVENYSGKVEDYDVTYPKAIQPGDYQVTVTFKGVYSNLDPVVLDFTIEGEEDTTTEASTDVTTAPGETTTEGTDTTEATSAEETTQPVVTSKPVETTVNPTQRTCDDMPIHASKPVIKKAKKSAKKLTVQLKKGHATEKYTVYVYKTKKNASKMKKAILKKTSKNLKITIKSKKIKKKKALYIRVKAIPVDKRTSVVWSGVKKVK